VNNVSTENASPLITQEKPEISIMLATMEHLWAAKRLADQHKNELGFINQAILRKAIEADSLLVALAGPKDESEVAGFVHFYVRRDQQITLYSIVVAQKYRHEGLGRRLFASLVCEAARREKREILLKCPAELPANLFYKQLGLEKVADEPGKHRALHVWKYRVQDA